MAFPGRFFWFFCLALAAGLASLSAPGFAREGGEEDLFTVFGVEVDVRAENATVAKRMALEDAENEAFKTLVTRLVREEDTAAIVLPEDFQAREYVLGLEVEKEQNSRVRYIGTISVTFDAEKMANFFSERNIPYVAFGPPKTLAFPLYWVEGDYLLWGERNTLKAVWEAAPERNRLTRYVLPRGTAAELTSISAGQVIEGRQENQLQVLMHQYGAGRMAAIGARVRRSTSGEVLALEMEIFRPLEGLAPEQRVFRPFPGEDDATLIRRALDAFLDGEDEAWKIQATTETTELSEMALLVPTENPGVWADVKTRLSNTPIVASVHIARMAIPETYIAIRFSGTNDQLALALRQKGLILFRAGRGYALIRQEDSARFLAGRGDQ